MLDLRRRAQDAIAELETNPRGELVIAANEATCIYLLPKVFSVYHKLFPAVQLQVDRSYGSRVVEAVMDNSADFGLTQLPVDEKRLQVVDIYRDEIRLIVPAGHPLAGLQERVAAQTLWNAFLLLPREGKTRARLNQWLEPVEDEIRVSMELDSTEMMKRFVHGRPGRDVPGRFQLPRGNRRRQTARHAAGSRTHDAPAGPDLPQGQGALARPRWASSRWCWRTWATISRPRAKAGPAGGGQMTCPHCLTEFDAEAPRCPHCGEPNRDGLGGVSDLHRDDFGRRIRAGSTAPWMRSPSVCGTG